MPGAVHRSRTLARALTACVALSSAACDRAPAAAPISAAPRFLPAPAGDDVAALVRGFQVDAAAAGRRVVVVVGAPWCEPCVRLHDAAARGQLDDVLGGVDLVEFNLDVDRERLATAGYGSRMIPLLVVPGADGRGSDRRMEGSIKGPAAVDEMRPRIAQLLTR